MPTSPRPSLDLGHYPRSRLRAEARPRRERTRRRTGRGLTLQLLAFVLLGLVLLQQAGQHGRVGLGAGRLDARGPADSRSGTRGSAPRGPGHVTAPSRDVGPAPFLSLGWQVVRSWLGRKGIVKSWGRVSSCLYGEFTFW